MSGSGSLAVDLLSSTIQDPHVATSKNNDAEPESRSSGQSDSVQETLEEKSLFKQRYKRSAHLQPPPPRAARRPANGSPVCTTQGDSVSGYITRLGGALDTSDIAGALQTCLRAAVQPHDAGSTLRPTLIAATTARVPGKRQQKNEGGEPVGPITKGWDVLQRDHLPSSAQHAQRLLVELNDQPYSDASPPTRASSDAHDPDIELPLQPSEAHIEEILSEISVQHMYQRQLVMPTISTLKSSWYRWAFGSRTASADTADGTDGEEA
ncbi:hypothetical protein DFP72DRAFT_1175072 [Ephemerocybe angulata]|uniref:Uncharacterized protein n=1 Tax=Ephemerocybe angulata TaxID=980116 RepID=A0A8H6HK40_9AGAR|nr:hypothetical protein DFP72DRAFT_1175072 [Tulosesus angulatus]